MSTDEELREPDRSWVEFDESTITGFGKARTVSGLEAGTNP